MSDRNKENMEAMIYGFLLGDGYVSKNGTIGFAGDKVGLENLKEDITFLYENPGKCTIKYAYSESPKYGIKGSAHSFISTRSVGRRYIELGATTGYKVEQDFLLPDWIVNGSYEVKKNFISGLYSAEGYTPNMQVNRKTLRTMGFNMHRRKKIEESLPAYLGQYENILTELDIEYEINLETRITCDENIRFEFQFNNNEKNINHLFSLLDLRYCPEKQKRINDYIPYYQAKKQIVDRLKSANKYSIENRNESATIIAEKFGINRDLIYQWRKRKSGVRLPSSFPTYETFKEQNLGELTGNSLESFLPSVFRNTHVA